jgi:DNA-directed RNA polymerase sigma subunit (sigma70/sigma32)
MISPGNAAEIAKRFPGGVPANVSAPRNTKDKALGEYLTALRYAQLALSDNEPVSLDMTVDKEDPDGELLVEKLRSAEEVDQYAVAVGTDFKRDKVMQILGQLNERDRQIITYRYGLVGGDGVSHTLKETGKAFGDVSGEAIRLIEQKVFERIRSNTDLEEAELIRSEN